MSDQIKNGKVAKVKSPYDYDVDGDNLALGESLKKELEDQGLEYRWIDWKKAKMNGGRSLSGWIVYKRINKDPVLGNIAAFADQDDLVRNGTMVLAVKTRPNAAKQRARIKAQNITLGEYQKLAAQDLREKGLGEVIEGFEKNSK